MTSLLKLHSWRLLILSFTMLLLLTQRVKCKDSDEDHLLQAINSYRQALNLPQLTKNKKAGCLADEIAAQMDKKPCPLIAPVTGQSPVTTYSSLLNKCKIEPSSVTDGVVLPVCVSKLTYVMVLTNYTRTPYEKYVNDSKYGGVGLGSEDDWMIMVLTTNAQSGSFSSGSSGVWGFGFCVFAVLLGGLLVN